MDHRTDTETTGKPPRRKVRFAFPMSRVMAKAASVALIGAFSFWGFQTLTQSSADTTDSFAYIHIQGGYSGTVSMGASDHTFGDCKGEPDQYHFNVTGSRTCSATQFGPMSIYVASISNVWQYGVTGYSSSDSSKASCFSGGCSVSFTSGRVDIYITISPRNTPPSAPSLSLNSVSQTSANVTWSGGDSGSGTGGGYRLYKNGSVYGTYGESYPSSVTVSGLSCGISYSLFVESYSSTGSASSNTVTARTTACPTGGGGGVTPPPSGGGGGTTTPPPSGGGGSTGGGSGGSTTPIQGGGSGPSRTKVTSSSIVNQPAPNVPPATPTNFTAEPDDGSSVYLSWDEDVAAGSYILERSTDNVKWETIQDSVTDTYYYDTDTKFATTFYYRLTAVGDNGLKSAPVTAQVLTNSFTHNAGVDKDLTLTSEDRVMSVVIPAAALADPANCQFAEPSTLASYTIKDYRQAYGPYQIICQNEDNSFVSSFQQSLKATADLSKGKTQQVYEAYAFAGFDGDNQAWQRFTMPADQKPPLLHFTWDEDYTGVSVFGKPKHTPFIVGVLWTLGILVLLAIGGFVGLRVYARYRYQRAVQAVQEDYWHKEHGV